MSRFLVSCCNVGGKLLVVDQVGTSATVEVVLDAPSTGLAVSAARERVYAAFPGGVRVLDLGLREAAAERYDLPGADAHDVKCMDDNLLVVETSFNRVTSYAAAGEPEWSWSPSSGEGDRSHVNSVTVQGSRVIASMFSPMGEGPPWSDRLAGALVEIPPDRRVGGPILAGGLAQPHSIVNRGDTLWLCESFRNRVVSFDAPFDGEARVQAVFPCYTRGLAMSSDWIVVGQSRSDAHFVRPLLGDRERPEGPGACGVWFVSLGDEQRFFVELPAFEVYDIIELPD